MKLSDDREETGYVALADALRAAIVSGRLPAGGIVPSTRELSPQHGVSRETARRAVKLLEREGLVKAEPRRGYRVQSYANDPDRGLPVAFVIHEPEEPQGWDPFSRVLLSGLQQAASDRGWSLLAIGTGRRSAAAVMQQLRDCRVGGLVLDVATAEYVEAAQAIGLPVVRMDAWEPLGQVDVVVQDSFQGGLCAAQFLLDRGHRRIGWLGPIAQSLQSRERFGGAAAALQAAGCFPAAGHIRDCASFAEIGAAARDLLARPDRPTAVLGLWAEPARALVEAALDQKLRPGKNIEIVGWVEESIRQGTYRAIFPRGFLPPTMTWSGAELARTALARLAERRRNPALPPLCIKLPVRLVLPEDTHSQPVVGRRELHGNPGVRHAQ